LTTKNVKDVKDQISDLKGIKADLNKKIDKIKESLTVNQDDEYEIINDLSKKAKELMTSVNTLTGMIKNGVELNKQRYEIEKELAEVEKKIERLSKIRAELAEVWE